MAKQNIMITIGMFAGRGKLRDILEAGKLTGLLQDYQEVKGIFSSTFAVIGSDTVLTNMIQRITNPYDT